MKRNSLIHENLIILVTSLGMFLSTLDTGIINVALPTLTNVFDSNLTIMMWTVTLYTLMLVSFITLFGKISDAIGKIKIFNFGIILFGIASLLCALSSTEYFLIIFRAIQGIGAAMVQATAAALITSYVSNDKQGKGLGIFSMALGLGPILGPSIGSILLNFSNWSMIFWINIPIIILIVVINQVFIGELNEERFKLNFDFIGNILMVVMLSSLILAITFLKSQFIIVLLIIFLISLWLFIKWESKVKFPLIPVTWLQNKMMLSLLFGIFTLGGSMSLGFIIPPFYIEQNLKLNTLIVGIVNLSAPLGMVIMSQFSNKLTKKFNNQLLLTLSILLMGISYLVIGLLQYNLLIWKLIVLLLFFGFGCGIYLPINTRSILNLVKKSQQATAGSLQRMIQNLGIALYSSVSSITIQIFKNHHNMIHGYIVLWIMASIILFIGFILSVKNLLGYKKTE
ncbi:TPA: MFS transporter [Staphylococcus aureus]|uniref:MFS transporter n=11 Tax=Bacilli TaxID=91061 RepID=A0ABZ3EEP9_9STAP|nr:MULTISPECIES: MFS transporter [Staphylococcus]HBO2456757.1 MFS transporter [Pseudomonas aeruginosa]ADA80266.1 putative MDR permease; possible multidrug efflux pump [Staphylococcus epidermidis]ATN03929.1 MFS transporter [Staphylococcus capitis]MBE7322907.1 MFS transporter [Staphylococcus capitis]MBF2243286.1 MFS transporter [Staphylococcus capitis]